MPKTFHSTRQQARAPLDRISAVVGAQGIITDPADLEPYIVDWRGFYRGATPAVVRPGNTKGPPSAIAAAPIALPGGRAMSKARARRRMIMPMARGACRSQ